MHSFDLLPANFDTFRAAYLEAALMTATDGDEDNWSPNVDDLAPSTAQAIADECAAFLTSAVNAGLLTDEHLSQAGCDYLLTRNGHGAGYWDRPETYGEQQAAQLTTLADSTGGRDLYRGDDGLVYQSIA